MFRSFDGQYSSKPKVDLRGRSRVEESREQVCFQILDSSGSGPAVSHVVKYSNKSDWFERRYDVL